MTLTTLSFWALGLGAAAAVECTYADLACSEVHAGAIGTTASRGETPAWFNVSVRGAGGTCGMHWTCVESIWPHLTKRGTGTATATTDAAVAFRLDAAAPASASAPSRPWPGAEATARCAAHVDVSDLKITGAGLVPGPVKHVIARKIAAEMESEACAAARAVSLNFSRVDSRLRICEDAAVASEARIRPADRSANPNAAVDRRAR